MAALNCRPEGPVLPKPTNLPDSPAFLTAESNLTQILDAAISGSIDAGWAIENTSFSLAVISLDQQDPGVPVWEYHHLAEGNTRGTKVLDRVSQYLIGSISKVVTVYILLNSGIDIDTPVVGLLPALGDPNSTIPWQNVTLRMLASYLGGTPANYGFSEYYFLKDLFLAQGLPPINDSDYPPCGVTGLNSGCSDQEFFAGMTSSYPVSAPMKRPAYSNAAFVVLGMALEAFTGKNYTQLVQEVFSDPLRLENTFPSPGDDDKAVIPPGESSWGSEYGANAPAGGLVSSVSDLSKFSYALLSRTLYLGATQVDAWLKPASFAGGPYTLSGMPWEIVRSLDFVPDHPHPIAVYGKSGGALAYRSQLSLVDEYGVAVVVLTAGSMRAAPILADALMATLIPAVDKAGREQAKKYEGNYTSRDEMGVLIEASIVQDADSLVLSSLRRNESDILSGLIALWTAAMDAFIPEIAAPIRIFPTQLSASNGTLGGEQRTVREVWHLWPEMSAASETALPGRGRAGQDCVAWTVNDWVHYGGEPLQRVVLHVDEDGDVLGLEVPFLRSGVLAKSG
ncbi:beta-lactamase/transpeptidase-like protein [Dactylonectria macrodidyma]|uniref:Beta-lactamase/transpeptidase-like protein n=1 Tax=Dactylonectria macrodidyma TaxID=307937 RepID=A0A9P9FSQ8_9HYPO|nr:beta-lactamase/transpeptidase-like protein [Dactylonectria macrodidyma]